MINKWSVMEGEGSAFLAGFFIGVIITALILSFTITDHWKDLATKHGCAYYDSIKGDFHWKDTTK